MNDRYMVISPDTLEAIRRAGHAAKLEARIERLEAALREIINLAEVKGEGAYLLGFTSRDIAKQALGETK